MADNNENDMEMGNRGMMDGARCVCPKPGGGGGSKKGGGGRKKKRSTSGGGGGRKKKRSTGGGGGGGGRKKKRSTGGGGRKKKRSTGGGGGGGRKKNKDVRKVKPKKRTKLEKATKVGVTVFRRSNGTGNHSANPFILFFLDTWKKQGGNVFQVAKECGKAWWKLKESEKNKYRQRYCAKNKNSRVCRPKPGNGPKPKEPRPKPTGPGPKPTGPGPKPTGPSPPPPPSC